MKGQGILLQRAFRLALCLWATAPIPMASAASPAEPDVDPAETRGVIVCDTKFEFGLINGQVTLVDEVLTPDSSRFWPRDAYKPGGAQPSFDKQFVRDYLERIRWNKQPPVPSLPDDVIEKTREKYVEAFRRLTGRELAA